MRPGSARGAGESCEGSKKWKRVRNISSADYPSPTPSVIPGSRSRSPFRSGVEADTAIKVEIFRNLLLLTRPVNPHLPPARDPRIWCPQVWCRGRHRHQVGQRRASADWWRRTGGIAWLGLGLGLGLG